MEPHELQNKATEIQSLLPKLESSQLVLTHWRLDYATKARPKQLPPNDDWLHWLFMAGRGAGKTWAGANWIGLQAAMNPGYRCAVVAATQADVRRTCFEGESGLLNLIPPELLSGGNADKGYNKSQLEITFDNGSMIQGFSAEKPDRLRGPQFHAAWCDELAAWQTMTQTGSSNNQRETWDMLHFGLRLGDDPRCIITTTPRPQPLIRELMKANTTVISHGTTYENRDNLAPSFLNQLVKKYEGTRLGSQELEAKLLEDLPGALWTHQMIEDACSDHSPDFVRVVVGVDPSGSDDETGAMQGIVTCGLGANGKFYVIEDASVQSSPEGWTRTVIAQYEKHNADLIVAEKNYGGDMVRAVNENAMPNAPVELVTATRGKHIRAEPIAMLYEQDKVRHLSRSPDLESQMTLMTAAGYEGDEVSPDRLDALVWALTKLSEGDQHSGNVFRRSSWRLWPKDNALPSCDYIVMSWFIPPVGQSSFDLPTCTVWGCFKAKAYKDNGTEYTQDHAILLDHHHQATTAAEVLKAAKEIYSKLRGTAHIRIILEDTASNAFFRQEMRRSRVPASYWSPKSSTGEKRFEEWALQASTVLDEGRVFYPDKEWARDIVNEVAHFPHGTRNDFANSISLLLLFLRARKAIELPLDELEDIEEERLKKEKNRFRRRKLYNGR